MTNISFPEEPPLGGDQFHAPPAIRFPESAATGNVVVEDDGFTSFRPDPQGAHRYLVLPAERRERLIEALVQLSSEPPHH